MVGISRFQRRFRILAAVLIAVLFASGITGLSPASAQDGDADVVDGSARALAGTISPGGIVAGSDGGGPVKQDGSPVDTGFPADAIFPWTCRFLNIYQGIPTSDPAYTTEVPTIGARYHLRCSVNPGWENQDYQPIDDTNYVYNPGVGLPGVAGSVTIPQIRTFAQGLATPTTLTAGLSPELTQITGIETWFWPEGSTDTVTATASAGTLTVTVEARYVQTVFTIGGPDGDSFTCSTFVEWTPGAVNSPCTYAFTEETPNQTVTAASQWDFYWFDNALQPTPEVYATVINTEVSNVEVIDLEAVISRN